VDPGPAAVAHLAHAGDRAQEARGGARVGAQDGLDAHVAAAGERAQQTLARAVGRDAALVDDDHARADGLDLGQDVRGDEHGVLRRELAQDAAHLDALQRVEAARGLVQDQHLRRGQQRDGQAHALAQAAREAPHEVARAVAHADALQHFGDARARQGARQAVQAGVEAEHLFDAQLAVERHALGQVADAAAHLQRAVHHVVARDGNGAAGGGQVARQDAHGGGLPRSVGPEQADHLALRDLEGDVVEGDDGAETAREMGDRDHAGSVATSRRAHNVA
jgi:hypothetical protein